MTYKHILKTALTGLSTNRSRSALTIFGIVIGITAIMLVISLGAGAQALILGQIQGLGTNTVAVIPGREPTGPSDVTSLYLDSLKEKDIVALEKPTNVPGLQSIMPVVFGAASTLFGSNTYQVSVFGGTEKMAQIFYLHPAEGEFFGEGDVLSRSDVVVLGSKVAEDLFDGDSALNQKIKIKSKNFRVIGILP